MTENKLSQRIEEFAQSEHLSDIHIHAGCAAAVRVDGKITLSGETMVSAEQLHDFAETHLSQAQQQTLNEQRCCDAHVQCGSYHFRANFYYASESLAVALRKINHTVPNISELGLPSVITEVLKERCGLFLVTGATGAGKTTSLAALAQHLLECSPCHLVSIEDPIEYRLSSQRSVVSQRQLGSDARSFEEALYAALREDPDIILLGEMRTPQTIELALVASGLGHLVMATSHAGSCTDAIARLVNAFGVDAGNAEHVRMQLADSLIAVMSQKLVEKKSGRGRVAAYELLIANTAVRHSIRSNQVFHLPSIIETSQQEGMQTFHHALERLAKTGHIHAHAVSMA